MALDPTARRRWFGAVVLLAALLMLVCGETVLKGRLAGLVFIAYWLTCVCFTVLAIVVALLDARALQRRTRRQQQDLFEATLKEIEVEARKRQHSQAPNRGEKNRGRH